MADRVRVTSLIGGTERLKGPGGTLWPVPGAGLGVVDRRAPHPVRRAVALSARETADECSSWLIALPQLFWARRSSPGGRRDSFPVMPECRPSASSAGTSAPRAFAGALDDPRNTDDQGPARQPTLGDPEAVDARTPTLDHSVIDRGGRTPLPHQRGKAVPGRGRKCEQTVRPTRSS